MLINQEKGAAAGVLVGKTRGLLNRLKLKLVDVETRYGRSRSALVHRSQTGVEHGVQLYVALHCPETEVVFVCTWNVTVVLSLKRTLRSAK